MKLGDSITYQGQHYHFSYLARIGPLLEKNPLSHNRFIKDHIGKKPLIFFKQL